MKIDMNLQFYAGKKVVAPPEGWAVESARDSVDINDYRTKGEYDAAIAAAQGSEMSAIQSQTPDRDELKKSQEGMARVQERQKGADMAALQQGTPDKAETMKAQEGLAQVQEREAAQKAHEADMVARQQGTPDKAETMKAQDGMAKAQERQKGADMAALQQGTPDRAEALKSQDAMAHKQQRDADQRAHETDMATLQQGTPDKAETMKAQEGLAQVQERRRGEAMAALQQGTPDRAEAAKAQDAMARKQERENHGTAMAQLQQNTPDRAEAAKSQAALQGRAQARRQVMTPDRDEALKGQQMMAGTYNKEADTLVADARPAKSDQQDVETIQNHGESHYAYKGSDGTIRQNDGNAKGFADSPFSDPAKAKEIMSCMGTAYDAYGNHNLPPESIQQMQAQMDAKLAKYMEDPAYAQTFAEMNKYVKDDRSLQDLASVVGSDIHITENTSVEFETACKHSAAYATWHTGMIGDTAIGAGEQRIQTLESYGFDAAEVQGLINGGMKSASEVVADVRDDKSDVSVQTPDVSGPDITE